MRPGTEVVNPHITDQMIPSVSNVYQIIEHRGPGPYNSLCHTDNRKCFLGLSLIWNRREKCVWSFWRGKWEKFGDGLTEKKASLS